ncbi:MAG: TonB-dependent receptor [Burkholderiales bacterium]|nr:TonB-dependent receptor [Burkholderiales bacterium]
MNPPSTLACLALIAPALAWAQATTVARELEAVTVKGEAVTASRDQPYSMQAFGREEFRERQVTQPEQLFREVPGMEVRGLGYGGVANSITLRGFSGGGHGGDIGFVIDGIPLNEASSHADGYADLNVLVPLELSSMKVYRGPVSALYGNYNRAGVVAFDSRKGGRYRDLDLKLGDHGTLDLQGAFGAHAGAEGGGVTLNGAVQLYRTDSWREQSGNQRGTVALRGAMQLAPGTQLALSTRLHTGSADTASVITQAQFDNRELYARKNPNVQNDSSDKNFATLRADLSHTITPELKLLAFAYGTQQDFRRSFTRLTNAATWQQREEAYDRDVLGAGLNLNGSHRLADRPLNWVAGIERYSEDTHYTYADALANGVFTPTTTTAGVAGGSGTLDRLLATRTDSLFAQGEWALHPLLRPSLGVRHDHVGGGCEVRGLETRTGASAQCNDMQDFHVTTPKVGVRSTWLPGVVEARASVAEGFALPGDAAKFTAGLAVQPTTFRQRELGLTFTPGESWLIDVAHFRTDSRDEVALADPATLTYANVGSTRRQGLEAEIRFMPSDMLEFTAALARVRTEVLASLPTTPWLVGSEITGVPRYLATFTATVRPAAGFAVTAIARSLGRYAISQPSATTPAAYYGGYRTIDLMASHDVRGNAASPLGAKSQRYYVQVGNLTDRRYATSAGITGGTRTYNPGAPRSITLGTSLQF